MKNQIYDLIIIGSGPAGLTAGIYSSRYKLNSLIVGRIHGGTPSEYHEINNFPTYSDISSQEFIDKMLLQVKKSEVSIIQDEVTDISKENKNFNIKTSSKNFTAKNLLITTGKEKKKLLIKGEKEFTGRGVSYCATCDAGFFKDKTIAVIGGGDSALTEALLLSKYAKKTYIFYRGNKFSAEPSHIKEVKKNPKIEIILNSEVSEIFGEKKVTGVLLKNKDNISLDGVFIQIGSVVNEELIKKLGLAMDDFGQIKVNKKQETSIPGIYAAGDITDNPLKQVLTACAEGAIAAHSVYELTE